MLLDAADAGWESGQVGRANNLLKEARQSACSESEPGLHGGLEAWTGSAVQHGRGPLRGKIKNPSRALEEDLVSL